MIANEINLFWSCFSQKPVLYAKWDIKFLIIQYVTGWIPEHISRFLCNIKLVEIRKNLKHAMTLTLLSFNYACEWTQCFLQQYANYLAVHIFDCCLSVVRKFCCGNSRCHDGNLFTLHQLIRLQHFEQGNVNKTSRTSLKMLQSDWLTKC